MVLCDRSMIDKAGCFGVPDLLVEILSPHTKKKDIKYKYDLYEEVGVGEYWVVMPEENILQVFLLENGKYQLRGSYTEEDIISPTLFPDLSVDLGEVFP